MTIMSRPSYYHIDTPPPTPPPARKAAVKKDEGKKPKKKTRGQAKAEKERKEFKLTDVLIAYFNDKKEISQNEFSKIRGVPRATFQRHWRDCGLASLKKRGGCEEQAKHILAIYFAEKTAVSEKARKDASKLCQYLTDDEQVSLLQMCGLVACIGTGGVTDDDQLAIINEIVSESSFDVEEDDRIHVCKEVLKNMQEKFKELVKLKTPASIDPKRAEKATEETRDSMFSRLEYYVELLNKLGLVPWKSFSDVPASCKYGMDEVGTDTTKRMGKILVPAELLGPLFQITPEGDNKMNHHITLCITTRADGKKEMSIFNIVLLYNLKLNC
jgi:hypothetical protein